MYLQICLWRARSSLDYSLACARYVCGCVSGGTCRPLEVCGSSRVRTRGMYVDRRVMRRERGSRWATAPYMLFGREQECRDDRSTCTNDRACGRMRELAIAA